MELAAAKFAISNLSPIINKLGSYVYDSYFGGDVTAEEMEDLAVVILPTIKTVIQKAEFVPLEHLGPWLEKLQAAAFEAEDLIDLYEYKKIKNKIKNKVSCLQRINKYKNKTKETLRFMLPKSSLKVSLEKLQKSAEEARKLLPLIESTSRTKIEQLGNKKPPASASTSTVSTPSFPIFVGREKECDFIIGFLLNESNPDSNGIILERIPIITIHGMGGSGKTTTAQRVYNDDEIVKLFDLRIWVHVSRIFDVHRLTKEIIESASKGECPRIDSLDVLQTKLKELVSNKKILLVLDDIWCENKMEWNQLLSPLNEVKRDGSRIIITTRTEKVAFILQVDKVISLEELNMEDCWSILKHYAFGNSETTTEDMELKIIGNQIISKVKNCPLALSVVGSLLYRRVNVNEWKNILRQDMLKETMDVLLLSFQYLPSHLQNCFAYCSLFPKGFKFNINGDGLVHLWIAQGFVENTIESELTLEEKGRIYIKELLSYSFFKRSDEDEGCFKIHDLLHDLAEKVSKKYCYRIEDSLNIPATCIHLSILKENWKKVDILDKSKLKNLRSLLIWNGFNYREYFEDKRITFQNLPKLRSLVIESSMKMKVPCKPGIIKLKHLRYLLVSGGIFGLQLVNLYHLQFFHLDGYSRTVKSPAFVSCEEVDSVNDFRYYNSFEPCALKLDSVNDYQLDSVNDYQLGIVESNAKAAEAMLNKQKNSIEGLEACPNLETLFMVHYQGVRAPNWMNNENCLPRLLKLHLIRCRSLKVVPCLPSCLKELHVIDCNDLIQLPLIGGTLHTLKLKNCSKLTAYVKSPHLYDIEIVRCARNQTQIFYDFPFLTNLRHLKLEGFSNLRIFPNLCPTLAYMKIEDFPELTSLGNLQYCTSLHDLRIRNCPMLTSFVAGATEGNAAECLPCSVKTLDLIGLHRPFLRSLEENLYQLSSLERLSLEGFTTLPSLEKLSSLHELFITNCPDVRLLPNLPVSLRILDVRECPNLKADYDEGGLLCNFISHIPSVSFW